MSTFSCVNRDLTYNLIISTVISGGAVQTIKLKKKIGTGSRRLKNT